MKNQLISSVFLTLLILTACNTKEEKKGNYYKIGAKEWHIEFPNDYVSFANMPDTLEYNTICGKLQETNTVILLQMQQDDTLWREPIPNNIFVFLAPKNDIQKTKQECVEDLIKKYSVLVEYGGSQMKYRYSHKEKDVSIDGMKFIELENSILDSTGVFSHGDIQYIGTVSNQWMAIQLSFNNMKEREKLRKLVLTSKFEANK